MIGARRKKTRSQFIKFIVVFLAICLHLFLFSGLGFVILGQKGLWILTLLAFFWIIFNLFFSDRFALFFIKGKKASLSEKEKKILENLSCLEKVSGTQVYESFVLPANVYLFKSFSSKGAVVLGKGFRDLLSDKEFEEIMRFSLRELGSGRSSWNTFVSTFLSLYTLPSVLFKILHLNRLFLISEFLRNSIFWWIEKKGSYRKFLEEKKSNNELASAIFKISQITKGKQDVFYRSFLSLNAVVEGPRGYFYGELTLNV